MPYKHDPTDPRWLAHVAKYDALRRRYPGLTTTVLQIVGSNQERLRTLLTQDPYLNNIPLQLWDRYAEPLSRSLVHYDYNEESQTWTRDPAGRLGFSLGEVVCLLKQIARHMTSREFQWPTPASPPSSPATSAPSKSPASSSTVPSPTISPSPSDPPPSPSKPT